MAQLEDDQKKGANEDVVVGWKGSEDDTRFRLKSALRSRYPVLDELMLELLVDQYIREPDATDEDLIARDRSDILGPEDSGDQADDEELSSELSFVTQAGDCSKALDDTDEEGDVDDQSSCGPVSGVGTGTGLRRRRAGAGEQGAEDPDGPALLEPAVQDQRDHAD